MKQSFDRKNGTFNKRENMDYKKPYSQKSAYKNTIRQPKETTVSEDAENIVAGRNPVMEAIKGGRTIDKIFVVRGEHEGSIIKLIAMAKDEGIPVVEADKSKLENICGSSNHQGVVAFTTPFEYCDPEDILEYAKTKEESPFILILDKISDPRNLGAIIRTADACGVHGIIMPKRNSCGLTATVFKAAAGACEYAHIAKVVNISETINMLKDRGVWVYGADGEGTEDIYTTDFSGSAALVLGEEGSGISRLVKERCDKLVKIPMKGNITSLNVSVAGAVMMYEVVRQKQCR